MIFSGGHPAFNSLFSMSLDTAIIFDDCLGATLSVNLGYNALCDSRLLYFYSLGSVFSAQGFMSPLRRGYTNSLVNATFGSGKKLCSLNFVLFSCCDLPALIFLPNANCKVSVNDPSW